jgi:hypothetical protein
MAIMDVSNWKEIETLQYEYKLLKIGDVPVNSQSDGYVRYVLNSGNNIRLPLYFHLDSMS